MKKLTIETQFETYAVEFKNIDVSLEQAFNSFKGLLIASSWMPESIDEYIVEWAESIKDLKGVEEDGFETYEKVKEEMVSVDDLFEPTPLQQEFVGFNYLIRNKDE